MEPTVFTAALAGGVAVGLGGYAGWWRRFGPPTPGAPAALAYHKIATPELGGTWCTRRQFAAHLDWLVAHCEVIEARTFEMHLDTAPSRAAAGALPSVLLTFDDAFESFATHAWPALEARQLPPLLFVITDFVGRRASWDLRLPGRRAPHLDWPALRDLVAAGVEIGSHTRTHRDLRKLDATTLTSELGTSRDLLEQKLGISVRALSYPFGRTNAAVCAAARSAGYQLGFSMCPPGPNARQDRLALRRWGVYLTDSTRAVAARVQPGAGFWLQDLWTRGINAAAAVAARHQG